MKKKLLIILTIIISLCLGFFISSVYYTIKNEPLLSHFCHKMPLTTNEKQEVLSKYKPVKNPFFNIPDWYDKQDLLKTKNFYIQNKSNENKEISCFNSEDIYSWKNNAYLEFEDGSFYKVDCNK